MNYLDVGNGRAIAPCEVNTKSDQLTTRTQLRSIDLRFIDFLGIKYNQRLGFGTRQVLYNKTMTCTLYFVW
jgi:hypothetical protein